MKELNKQVNDIFFKALHTEQMESINKSIIEEAGAIMLKLMEAISDNGTVIMKQPDKQYSTILQRNEFNSLQI